MTANMHISWDVALFARAWIEIDVSYKLRILSVVALFARAWIEIGLS